MFVHHMCTWCTQSPDKVLNPQELALQVVVSCDHRAVNQTQSPGGAATATNAQPVLHLSCLCVSILKIHETPYI